MFNRYFGKKVEYKEIYVDNDGSLKYKEPVLIDGSVMNNPSGSYSSEWLGAKSIKQSFKYRVNKKLNIGDIVNDAKVLSCNARGFGSRTDYYEVNAVKYNNMIINKDDLTMKCLVEHLTGYSELTNSPVYSPIEEVNTFKIGQKEIFRYKDDGTIEAVGASCYIFLSSFDIKSGDKIDGYIVNQVVEYPCLDGSISYKEAYVCK